MGSHNIHHTLYMCILYKNTYVDFSPNTSTGVIHTGVLGGITNALFKYEFLFYQIDNY